MVERGGAQVSPQALGPKLGPVMALVPAAAIHRGGRPLPSTRNAAAVDRLHCTWAPLPLHTPMHTDDPTRVLGVTAAPLHRTSHRAHSTRMSGMNTHRARGA